MVREIAGRHMFNDANKRTATAVVNELRRRNNVFTGVEGSALRDVINRVATGELRTIDEIMVALRGF
jgi:prophage maintenance system killer protein